MPGQIQLWENHTKNFIYLKETCFEWIKKEKNVSQMKNFNLKRRNVKIIFLKFKMF